MAALPGGHSVDWCMRQDSNLGPLEYQSSALPTELRMHGALTLVRAL